MSNLSQVSQQTSKTHYQRSNDLCSLRPSNLTLMFIIKSSKGWNYLLTKSHLRKKLYRTMKWWMRVFLTASKPARSWEPMAKKSLNQVISTKQLNLYQNLPNTRQRQNLALQSRDALICFKTNLRLLEVASKKSKMPLIMLQ